MELELELEKAIEKATVKLSTYWPLTRFIATNPLWDQTDQSFLSLIEQDGPKHFCFPIDFYQKQYGGRISEKLLKEAIVKVCQTSSTSEINTWFRRAQETTSQQENTASVLFIDHAPDYQHQKASQWLEGQAFEWLLMYFGSKAHSSDLLDYWLKNATRAYPETASILKTKCETELLLTLLEELGVDKNNYDTYLAQVAMRLFGWGSLLKWKISHPHVTTIIPEANIPQLLAIWLTLEWIIKERTGAQYSAGVRAPDPFGENDAKTILIWQTAYELSYQEDLLKRLKKSTSSNHENSTPKAQLVFCIDVRSEALRRHIEHQSGYQTFGFAGFFGFAFALGDGQETKLQCPAIVKPQLVLKSEQAKHNIYQSVKSGLLNSISARANANLGTFQVFELFGFWSLGKLIGKTFLPRLFKNKLKFADISLDINEDNKPNSIKLSDAVDSAYGFLKTINLTTDFAPHVLICAHQSTSDNNAYAAALDCGACGGNSGIPNALIACKVLNHDGVRLALQERGIHIPKETQFIATCHHTVTDEIEILESELPADIIQNLKQASSRCQLERQDQYPNKQKAKRRESDWSELLPEVGLANNAAIVIGPRSKTEKINLQSRVFLHSYSDKHDEDGTILESILLAPVIVAHWINSQYYFSTVCSEVFGAGNKAIHNVVPEIGVIAGNISDLKIGLPEQSVRYRGKLLHEPARLMVAVYTSKDKLNSLINKHQKLKDLRDGHWVRFEAIDN